MTWPRFRKWQQSGGAKTPCNSVILSSRVLLYRFEYLACSSQPLTAMTTHPLLYLDMLSQPSRAVEILCRVNGLDVERKIVRIGRGEHQTPEYLAVNPLGKVPFLVVRLAGWVTHVAA